MPKPEMLVVEYQTPGDILSRRERPATREDVLAAVRELGGLEVDFRAPIMVPGKLHVEDMWMRAGRYLIVPLDTGDTE